MKKYFSPEEMPEIIKAFIKKKYKTQSNAADNWLLSPHMVYKICSGDRLPSKIILKDMGFEKEREVNVRYRRK